MPLLNPSVQGRGGHVRSVAHDRDDGHESHHGAIRIVVVTPAARGSRAGNRTTALRWARIFRALGHRALVTREWAGQPCDVLVALHARKSAASVDRFHRAHPERPRIVALTGTDLYGDLRNPRVRRSLHLAHCIVLLQPLGRAALPPAARLKARVILQSADLRKAASRRSKDHFGVCVLGHLRPVKDPFRAALASRLLPVESRILVFHIGAAMSPSIGKRAREEERRNPRYRWLREKPRAAALEILARSRLMVISSRGEGGANVVSEALACGIPVLASNIPGNVGILGAGYPGMFRVGDTRGLADLLMRAESDPPFLSRLESHGRRRAQLLDPRREAHAWKVLLAEIRRPSCAQHGERARRRDPRRAPTPRR